MDERVRDLIDGELKYQKKWDELPPTEREKLDGDKSVEFWVLHMERYLDMAKAACGGTDKTEALVNIRKVTALGAQCMTWFDVPPRE